MARPTLEVDCVVGTTTQRLSSDIVNCDDMVHFVFRFEEAGGSCGVQKDCTGVPDGRYPICELDCTWYYSCFEGNNGGNTICNEGL